MKQTEHTSGLLNHSRQAKLIDSYLRLGREAPPQRPASWPRDPLIRPWHPHPSQWPAEVIQFTWCLALDGSNVSTGAISCDEHYVFTVYHCKPASAKVQCISYCQMLASESPFPCQTPNNLTNPTQREGTAAPTLPPGRSHRTVTRTDHTNEEFFFFIILLTCKVLFFF